jgi:hypothetical protein
MKFKLKKGKGSVDNFTDAAGVKHLPGDVVELPKSYLGEKWLEPVEPKPEPTMVPVKPEEPVAPKKEKKSKS